ncbi:ribosomal protein L7/L12 [Lysobacter enzymogenes]|uniref:ribosomal protein L7/L12 n=1 Tax=Lysobacter enzymogenes TaxID=69 RepID=UPI003392DD87
MTSVVSIIVACPHCGQPNHHAQLASLTLWLVRLWSDGWSDPTPTPSALYRCGVCNTVAFHEQFAYLGNLKWADHVYDVDLQAPGPDRVKTMQVLRRFTGVDLQQAKSWLQNPPSPIATGLTLDRGNRITDALQAVGAQCSVHTREIDPGSPESWQAAPSIEEANDAAAAASSRPRRRRRKKPATGPVPTLERALP